MKSLLYKEFKLSIHPLFYLVSLLTALILIPNWIYFLAMAYLLFITMPNVFATCKAENDIGFAMMLPVRKKDIVKARFISIITIEMINILVAVIFAIINFQLYAGQNLLMDPNAAFFGFVLIMYAIFNAIFLPGFYKTGYKIGLPIMIANVAAIGFATIVEFAVIANPLLHFTLDDPSSGPLWKVVVLLLGVIIFLIVNVVSYKIAAKRFERINL